jgi:peptidyl-prolyl cis-trans isomerase C
MAPANGRMGIPPGSRRGSLKGSFMFARVVLRRTWLAAPLIVLLATPFAAHAQPGQIGKTGAPDPVLARVNGHDIHSSDVMALIRRLPQQTQEVPMEKLVPAMVDTLINSQLIQEAADKGHLQNDPEVKRRLAVAEDEIIRQLYMERLVAKDLTDSKLHAEYDAYIKSVPRGEEINARHILVKSEAEAKQIIAQLEHGADFVKLAKEKSIDPAGKESGGDLGWFTKDQMVPEFADAAFSLKIGQFSKTPVKTRFGWHVIKLVDRRTAPPPSFDDVKRELVMRIQGEVIGTTVKELRSHAKIEIIGPDGKPVPEGPASAGASDATSTGKKKE